MCPKFHSWQTSELQFALSLFTSKVHASALFNDAKMLKHVGEEKGPFDLLTFSGVGEQTPYFKRLRNLWMMDSIELMYYLLGICYVMRNCSSCCRYKDQQDLIFALKELEVWKEQNTKINRTSFLFSRILGSGRSKTHIYIILIQYSICFESTIYPFKKVQ